MHQFNFGTSMLCVGIVCVATLKILAKCEMVVGMIGKCNRMVQQPPEIELVLSKLNNDSSITVEGVKRVMPMNAKTFA